VQGGKPLRQAVQARGRYHRASGRRGAAPRPALDAGARRSAAIGRLGLTRTGFLLGLAFFSDWLSSLGLRNTCANGCAEVGHFLAD
jgi:hypothetical protein